MVTLIFSSSTGCYADFLILQHQPRLHMLLYIQASDMSTHPTYIFTPLPHLSCNFPITFIKIPPCLSNNLVSTSGRSGDIEASRGKNGQSRQPRGGRGLTGRSGKGRRSEPAKPKTQEELDAEMDAYMHSGVGATGVTSALLAFGVVLVAQFKSRDILAAFYKAKSENVNKSVNMSGRGKGAKGLGKSGSKRHRKILRETIKGVSVLLNFQRRLLPTKRCAHQQPSSKVTRPAIRRLARRGGVKRISAGLTPFLCFIFKSIMCYNSLEQHCLLSIARTPGIYDETRLVLKRFLTEVIHDVCVYVEYKRKKTITPLEVIYALKKRGTPLYGFDNT
ncbi:hypothetical protein BC937DRAFT_93701 [Endogone sp. FLAS-F59071]|nr:hypothetical protein BC937DRAFT_93701 [Endogone sp. FLAS-F59071]|eukprot:RUS14516.1 hypothetical protein BC937DRAFT_93701 [Endogone sp. FLAS-F59071]